MHCPVLYNVHKLRVKLEELLSNKPIPIHRNHTDITSLRLGVPSHFPTLNKINAKFYDSRNMHQTSLITQLRNNMRKVVSVRMEAVCSKGGLPVSLYHGTKQGAGFSGHQTKQQQQKNKQKNAFLPEQHIPKGDSFVP